MHHHQVDAVRANEPERNWVAILVLHPHAGEGPTAISDLLERLGFAAARGATTDGDPSGSPLGDGTVERIFERLARLPEDDRREAPVRGDALPADPSNHRLAGELAEALGSRLRASSAPVLAVARAGTSCVPAVWREALAQIGVPARALLVLHPLADGVDPLAWLEQLLAMERDTRGMMRSFVASDAGGHESARIARDLGLARRDEHIGWADAPPTAPPRRLAETGGRLYDLADRCWQACLDLLQDPSSARAQDALDAVSGELGALRGSGEAPEEEVSAATGPAGRSGRSPIPPNAGTLAPRSWRDGSVEDLRWRADRADFLDRRIAGMEAELERLRAQSHRDRAQLEAVLGSSSWRLVQPIRRAMDLLPASLRRLLRRGARLAWWAVTPWRTGARLAVLRAQRNGTALLSAGGSADGAPLPSDEAAYRAWVERYDTLSDSDRAVIRERIARLGDRPLLSIVVPVYDTPEAVFRAAVASVQAQLYENWELCIADDASPAPHVAGMLADLEASDPRIRIVRRAANGHIAAASNSALELARGAFVILMDHDDLLAEHALYEVARALDERPDTDILYSDEDKIDEAGRRFEPYFKPDFSYDLLLGQNVVSHLGAYRTALLREVGGFRAGVDGSQDYDLALRCAARTAPERIRHIPRILYHWRQPSDASSFSQSTLDACIASARKAIQDHLDETHEGAGPRPVVEPSPDVPSWSRVRWPVPEPAPLVSVIVPTRDHAKLLKPCVDGLLHRTHYPNIEILVVDNGSAEPETHALFASWADEPRIRVLPRPGPFNYSRLNNEAVREAKGDILLLLNNDIDVIDGGWLREMVSLVSRPGVGAVGAKLLYADRRVQHAGLRMGGGSYRHGPGVASHFGQFVGADDPGYFGRYVLTQDVGGVTGACLMTTRAVFEEVGGLDEAHLAVAFNDVDLCLRIREAGHRILWTPHATLFHLESASRGSDATPEKMARFDREVRYMRGRWGPVLDRDPFYNPAFDNVVQRDYVLGFPAAGHAIRD